MMESENSSEIIVLSADSPRVLLILASQLLIHISKTSNATSNNSISGQRFSLADLAYTLQSCREEMHYRLAIVVNNLGNLSLGLAQYLLSEGHITAEAQQILKLAQSTVPISVHRGDTKSNSQLQSLLSGSSGELMMNVLLLEGDLNSLAVYWTKGGNIPWELLHAGKFPRKIDLPAYPIDAIPQKQPTTETEFFCSNSEFEERPGQNITTESVETLLLKIWKELLGSTQIGRNQNFFEIGGDSRLGMHMISLVRDTMNVDLPLSYLYEAPTVSQMSEKIAFMMALSSAIPMTDDASAYQEYEEGIII